MGRGLSDVGRRGTRATVETGRVRKDGAEIIKSAAKADTQYQTLKRQIQIGWPSKIAELPSEIRKYYTLADELLISDDLVYKG